MPRREGNDGVNKNMSRRGANWTAVGKCNGRQLVVLIAAFIACAPAGDDVRVQQPYRRALLANPGVMEAGGSVIVERTVGRPLLIGVGYAIVGGKTKPDLLVGEARLEAMTAAASTVAPLHVVSESTSGDVTTVTVENGEERSQVIEKTTRLTQIQFQMALKGLRQVGTWRGQIAGEEAIFVAVGTEISPSTSSE